VWAELKDFSVNLGFLANSVRRMIFATFHQGKVEWD
jgi:hypothetical protein